MQQGKPRRSKRRSHEGKYQFKSLRDAQSAAEQLEKVQGEECEAYYCAHCGRWHIGHGKRG